MRISVIIPLYNCEQVIKRCLDSIDVIPDIKIVVVDDGSTDYGAAVVQAYMNAHPHVRIVKKENGGVSSARNVGIESACGEYVMFIDADDYLMHDGLETLLDLAEKEKADVLKYKLLKVGNTDAPNNSSLASFELNKVLISGKGKALKGAAVSDFHVVDGLFRRDVLINNGIRFHEDLYLHEDDAFMAEFYAVSECVVATNMPLYCYVVCSDYSHTHHATKERKQKIIDSALLAVKYRHAAVSRLNDEATASIERLKEMRYVYACSLNMLASDYTYHEYVAMLDRFEPYGCYPLKYHWLKVCLSPTPRLILKTFLCNHPRIAWMVYKKLHFRQE